MRAILFICAIPWIAMAQLPSAGAGRATVEGSRAAVNRSKQDPAAVARGGPLFVSQCGACHGATAKGTPKAADLVRSILVQNDEKGEALGPILRAGRPEKGMPKPNLTEAQIADISAWLRVQVYAAATRGTYEYLEIVTGDPKRGEAFFNGEGKCNTCHSVSGNLAHIGTKYDPPVLQSLWITGGGGGRGGPKSTVTVTMPGGKVISGTLDRVDDFNVVLRDSAGVYRSIERSNGVPKVEIRNPLQFHADLPLKVTDAQMHDMTAYLVSVK